MLQLFVKEKPPRSIWKQSIESWKIKTYYKIVIDTVTIDGKVSTSYYSRIKEKCLFIAGSRNHGIKNIISYFYITNESFNVNLSKKIFNEKNKIKNNFFNDIYSSNYNINNDGYILFVFTGGWYHRFEKNILEYFDEKIKNIRKYSDRKIVLRFKKGLKYRKNIIYKLEILDNNIVVENKTPEEELFKECYVCFIQNTKFIFDFVARGIPVFNLDMYTVEFFKEIYVDVKDIENLKNIELPDRKKFLEYHNQFIFEIDTLRDKEKFMNMLRYYKIIE